jgi:hypothetical protein
MEEQTCVATRSNSRTTGASNRSSNNKSRAVLGHSTYQAANFKNGNGEEKCPFEREVLISLIRLAGEMDLAWGWAIVLPFPKYSGRTRQ